MDILGNKEPWDKPCTGICSTDKSVSKVCTRDERMRANRKAAGRIK